MRQELIPGEPYKGYEQAHSYDNVCENAPLDMIFSKDKYVERIIKEYPEHKQAQQYRMNYIELMARQEEIRIDYREHPEKYKPCRQKLISEEVPDNVTTQIEYNLYHLYGEKWHELYNLYECKRHGIAFNTRNNELWWTNCGMFDCPFCAHEMRLEIERKGEYTVSQWYAAGDTALFVTITQFSNFYQNAYECWQDIEKRLGTNRIADYFILPEMDEPGTFHVIIRKENDVTWQNIRNGITHAREAAKRSIERKDKINRSSGAKVCENGEKFYQNIVKIDGISIKPIEINPIPFGFVDIRAYRPDHWNYITKTLDDHILQATAYENGDKRYSHSQGFYQPTPHEIQKITYGLNGVVVQEPYTMDEKELEKIRIAKDLLIQIELIKKYEIHDYLKHMPDIIGQAKKLLVNPEIRLFQCYVLWKEAKERGLV